MKTAKLILWVSVIYLVGISITTTVFLLVYFKIISVGFIPIPLLIMLLLILTQSQIISISIKEKLFLMKYDELINLIDEQDKSWKKAMKMIEVLGTHEAIKLYNEKYPKQKL